MSIDIVETYGCKVIEGLDTDEVLRALNDEGEYLKYEPPRTFHHEVSQKRITLECACKYFEPKESYFKLSSKSSCPYIKRALGQDNAYSCAQCIAGCIKSGLKLKPQKVIFSKNYFE